MNGPPGGNAASAAAAQLEPESWIHEPDDMRRATQLPASCLSELADFCGQLEAQFAERLGGMEAAVLPPEDESLLLELFKYSINNVGNPDGRCRHGATSRKFELRLLNHIFTSMNMNPYGETVNEVTHGRAAHPPDATASFGYFTLGEQEAALWMLRAAEDTFDGRPFCVVCAGDVSLRVVAACELYGVHQHRVDGAEGVVGRLEEFAAECGSGGDGEGEGVGIDSFVVVVGRPDTAEKIAEATRLIRDVRASRFASFVHVEVESVSDAVSFAQAYNPFVRNCEKFYAYPPNPSDERFQASGDFYVDTISCSNAVSTDFPSFSTGLLLTTVGTKKHFNNAVIPYIATQDSTVVGSSNGTFLMIDHYFVSRFPWGAVSELRAVSCPAQFKEGLARQTFPTYDRDILQNFFAYMQSCRGRSVGYPCSNLFECGELSRFFSLLIRQRIVANTENPSFQHGLDLNRSTHPSGAVYIKRFIKEVVSFYRREVWFRKHDPKSWKGYITTGGTEGNYVGFFLASRTFGKDAVLFLTEHAHYSVSKGASLFRLRTVEVAASVETGQMDAGHLQFCVARERLRNPNAKPVVCLNTASTMKGSRDSPTEVDGALDRAGVAKADRWLHVDGAMQGHIFPFLPEAEEILPFMRAPEDPGYVKIHSIAASVHKQLGSPVPAGICLFDAAAARRVHATMRAALRRRVERVKALDGDLEIEDVFSHMGTITTGTENSVLAVVVWKRVRELGYEGMRTQARHNVALARYAERLLREKTSVTGVIPFRNAHSNIIVLRPPPSTHVLDTFGLPVAGGESHIVVMPHVSRQLVHELVEAMAAHPADVL